MKSKTSIPEKPFQWKPTNQKINKREIFELYEKKQITLALNTAHWLLDIKSKKKSQITMDQILNPKC